MCDEFFWVKDKKQQKEKGRQESSKMNVGIKEERIPGEQRVKSSTHFFFLLFIQEPRGWLYFATTAADSQNKCWEGQSGIPLLENNFRHHEADTVIPDVHKEIRVADNEPPVLLSKYQTCLFSSAILPVPAFENSQTASFQFELSPSADVQAFYFIPSPAQRPHAPANRNSHTTVSQEETPSYLFLKIFFSLQFF